MEEFNPSAYNISIARRPVEGHFYFVGTVREFPHIRVYEDSWAESYSAVLGIIEDLYVEANELGEHFPPPMNEEDRYSGRVTARLPKWLHATLDAQARDENVSLNTHIVSLLTFASTNRAYAEISPGKSPALGGVILAEAKLSTTTHNVVHKFDKSVTFNEVHPIAVWMRGGFSSVSAGSRTETKTYRQELRHGQETRH